MYVGYNYETGPNNPAGLTRMKLSKVHRTPPFRPVLMGTEYTSKKSAHALSELKNVKNPTVMGTKYAWKNVKVNRVYF